MKNPDTGTLETKHQDTAFDTPPGGGAFLVEPVIQPIFTRENFSEEQQEIERMVLQFASERIQPARDDLAKLNQYEEVSKLKKNECSDNSNDDGFEDAEELRAPQAADGSDK